ncbi:endolytic transglycosylase MltG [Oxalobacteraceae bacterium R-40]|uniref:Endolytic murein transglycosylase n=1 Tax=Keguizhuia sedimenti TaxID=3064264 RepID=A0ABU1BRE1_9BURK|nr:endolytic transglycosylase MltG [Oxalobacteraceae bacterium R-40]
MIKKFLFLVVLGLTVVAAGIMFWSLQPIINASQSPIAFTVKPGSGIRSTSQQIAQQGIPVQPALFEILARITGKSAKIKAGTYEIKPGMTPVNLIDQLVRGEFAQESLAIIEGWTFKQMRQAIASHKGLKQDTASWTEKELLAKVAPEHSKAEGLFFPDTYRFAKGSSDLQVYKQAYSLMMKRLNEEWAQRDPDLPYRSPYEALIMASIVEKETGVEADRTMVAGVFVNRLKSGMMLQTDPTVIYGMGERFDGNIRKRDLLADTPYNTYTRTGLPPTPIALPGRASLAAAMRPAKTKALYFVARGDGSSHFSSSLEEHNRAVDKYQR